MLANICRPTLTTQDSVRRVERSSAECPGVVPFASSMRTRAAGSVQDDPAGTEASAAPQEKSTSPKSERQARERRLSPARVCGSTSFTHVNQVQHGDEICLTTRSRSSSPSGGARRRTSGSSCGLRARKRRGIVEAARHGDGVAATERLKTTTGTARRTIAVADLQHRPSCCITLV